MCVCFVCVYDSVCVFNVCVCVSLSLCVCGCMCVLACVVVEGSCSRFATVILFFLAISHPSLFSQRQRREMLEIIMLKVYWHCHCYWLQLCG